MLKIYDGNVVSIEFEFFENNRTQILNYCWDMPYPRDTYFLIWSDGKIVGATSYTSILCRVPCRQKVLQFTENVMREAREYFSALEDKGAEECIPVLDDEGVCLFLIVYIMEELFCEEQKVVLDLNLERDWENLDYTLMNRANVYFFHELQSRI